MNARKKYTHVFFDLDNTLWDFKRNSFLAMQTVFYFFELQHKQVVFEKFFEVYQQNNENLWIEYRSRGISKKELTSKRFQLTFDELNIAGIDPVEMNNRYLAEMPKQNILEKGALELLVYLKNKNYKLYIITNGFKEVQHKKLISANLQSFFDKVFISEAIKAPKPSKEIFEMAIKSANARKKESIMIGDDWDVDVLGAVNVGIDVVYYTLNNNSHISNNLNSSAKIYYISTLEAVKNILL